MTSKKPIPVEALLLAATALMVLYLAFPPTSVAGNTQRHDGLLYWGAQIGDQITGEQAPWDMRPVQKFQQLTGKGLSLIGFNSAFQECGSVGCQPIRFPTTPLENIRLYGAIPMFNWSTNSTPFREIQPRFRLSQIISGRYDSYIRYYAEEAKRWGHPFFLRLDWEMNGFWFPWGETSKNHNKPGEFVAAWRHIHDIFTAAGATNATWVWCPNVNISGQLQPLRQLYPGNRYVNWTCLDGFNWGVRHGSPGWLSFNQIFRKTYKQVVKLAPSKPMLIGETASSELGGSKASWIKNTLRTIRTSYRKARGLVWFDVLDRDTNWPIESSSAKSQKAFRAGIRNAAFRPNVFGDLPFGPISAPR